MKWMKNKKKYNMNLILQYFQKINKNLCWNKFNLMYQYQKVDYNILMTIKL